jgi:hypothetical protein
VIAQEADSFSMSMHTTSSAVERNWGIWGGRCTGSVGVEVVMRIMIEVEGEKDNMGT